MTFWILVSVLVVVAVAWLAPVLLREKPLRELDRKQQNVTIAKERLDEIAAEHASGEMTSAVYEQVKGELEASLIADVDDQDKDTGQQIQSKGSGKLVLLILVLLIPLGTVGLYQHLGSPHLLEYAGASAGRDHSIEHVAAGAESIEDLVGKLKARLEKNPEDGEGWYLLARTHMSRQSFPEALEALEKSLEVLGEHPAILTGMADATAMINAGDLTGKATGYLEKALELQPDNETALWLGGMAAQQAGKFQVAVDRWTRLIPLLGDESGSQQQVQELINQAVHEAKTKGIEVNVAEVKITPAKAITVKLSADVAATVSPDSAVYVFALAASGPPMPLAAVKVNFSQLPTEIVLDDSSAMMPELKISSIDEVVVSARVSMSGDPLPQAGDYSSHRVKMDFKESAVVDLVINHKISNPADIPMSEQQSTLPAETTDATEPVAIKAWVSLDAAMKDSVSGDDVVFVMAKAKAGPPMPLAAQRLTVSELPLEVTLDDSMAMMPQMKLSGFEQVVVSARVSKSGQPMASPGDISSQTVDVSLSGTVGVNLNLDRVVQ
ncbi:MAG: c-type cytochrome biogenesis protein CcmI [Gammaproteobacteria bacterium]|nr:c-type cytochrome biogenesis protein CcmI [Gammaproteobacteria bacterium]